MPVLNIITGLVIRSFKGMDEMKYVIDCRACLYTLVISSANGDMYVWMLLSNNAIVWYVLDEYLWHSKEAMMNHRYLAKKPRTMKTVTNLFLYLLNCYTLALVFLHSAFSTMTALSLSLQKNQQASSCSQLMKPAYNFRN